MSGLIWSALGEGVGNIGNAMSSYLAREADREDRQEERRRELEERRAYEERRDAMYKRTADQQAAAAASRGSGSGGGGAASGISAKDMGEGGADEGMVARRAGMTVPEMRALRKFSETGDMSPFGTKFKTLDDNYGEMESTAYPPGLEKELRAKANMLAKIEESYRMGDKYDDMTKGRQNQQNVDLTDAAVRNPSAAPVIGQGVAAGAGKPLMEIKEGTQFNQYTGGMTTTERGKSEIRENDAQAGQARAQAGKAAADAKATTEGRIDINGVAQNAANLIKLAEAAENDGRPEDARRLRAEAQRLSEGAGRMKVPQGEGEKEPPRPDLSKVSGLPKGAALGSYVQGRGWEVKVDGKVQGYVADQAPARSAPAPASAQSARSAATSRPEPAAPPPRAEERGTGMEQMSLRTLQQIANIPGHANQKAAIAELQRRQEASRMWEAERQSTAASSLMGS